MTLRPIRSDQDLQEAGKCFEEIWDAAPGTPEGEELEGIPFDCLMQEDPPKVS